MREEPVNHDVAVTTDDWRRLNRLLAIAGRPVLAGSRPSGMSSWNIVIPDDALCFSLDPPVPCTAQVAMFEDHAELRLAIHWVVLSPKGLHVIASNRVPFLQTFLSRDAHFDLPINAVTHIEQSL